MKIKRKKIYLVLSAVVFLSVFILMKQKKNDNFTGSVTEVRPVYGNLATMISTTGEVKPQNRLEIMPPIAGRIEKIYVREGDKVKTGDILALMSSTERAALLDAAQLNGKEEIEYWEKVYNATPLISPIDAEVIVRAVEPGQAVVATDAVIVLSDRLIVQADVDETDIGDVKVGCGASVSLDAYPRIEVNAVVDHISYESTLVNNVTIYEVDILPESIPDVFRSGMSANVDIITKSKNHVLIIPLKAVREEKGQNFVLLKSKGNGIVRQPVALGLSDSENVEVVSGISEDDSVIITTEKYLLSESKESGSNPFMPNFEKRRINKPSESRSLK